MGEKYGKGPWIEAGWKQDGSKDRWKGTRTSTEQGGSEDVDVDAYVRKAGRS